MKVTRISFLLLATAVAVVSLSPLSPRLFRAQSGKYKNAQCCGEQHPVAPREVDFPYYNLTSGWVSTLNLVSDSPKPIDFTLAIKGKLGQVLTAPETIQPQAKLAIDLASLIIQLGGDITGPFAEGSVAVYFTGTIMPLVGQITLRNPALSLAHESVMVEHDPGRSDIPAELDGLWWGLGTREARVMVSNTSALTQTANVFLDFQGQRHPLPTPLKFLPYETKTLDIAQLLASIGVAAAQAPEGGISIIQTGPQPALIANGRITDAATGFSSTIDFPWTAMQQSNVSALHASGLPIGTPSADSPFGGAGTFIPHVTVRNLIGSPQTVNITVEYPRPVNAGPNGVRPAQSGQAPSPPSAAPPRKFIPAPPVPGDPDHHPEWGAGTGTTVGTVTLGPFSVGAYSAVDFSLASAMSQLPPALAYCSIRIEYSGMPGSVQAQTTSVESRSNLVVDSHVQSEGNGWAGSGANPWHLDDDTESILFLTNEGDKPARMGFSVTANDVHYYLTKLLLNPHETRVIDLRQVRDAQVADFKGNKIPANATDGAVSWIRLDNVAVMGRLMVINRHAGMTSNYDCCICQCPASNLYLEVDPSSAAVAVGNGCQFTATDTDQSCNGTYYYYDWTDYVSWTSSNNSVAAVNSTGGVTAEGGGTATIYAATVGCSIYWDPVDQWCGCNGFEMQGSATVNVITASITVNLGPPPSSRSSSLSLGDNLSFPSGGSCGARVLGAQGCSAGWFWQWEAAGTVSDDAANWTLTQDENSRTITYTYTDLTHNTITTYYVEDNPHAGLWQKTAGTTSTFWLDSPGPYFSSNILSIDDQATKTGRICSTKTATTYCVCADWNYHLIGSANVTGTAGVTDTTNSSATITRTAYSCQPQR